MTARGRAIFGGLMCAGFTGVTGVCAGQSRRTSHPGPALCVIRMPGFTPPSSRGRGSFCGSVLPAMRVRGSTVGRSVEYRGGGGRCEWSSIGSAVAAAACSA